jgi:transcription-repair coupling factor (superfamily II helicase)
LSLGRINMESLPVEAGPSGRPTRTFRTTSIPSLRLTDTAPGPWPEDLPKTPITVFCRNIRILMATHAVCLVCPASGRAERLLELLAEHGVPAVPGAPSPSLPGPRGATPVRVVKGELSAGFMMDEPGILFVTAGEIFGEKPAKPPPPPKARAERFINSLSELSAGDCVVHIEHGIGRYKGMKRLKLVGVETDFLEVSYLGDDILYVPVDELGKLQKYIGAETARLDRLGGAAWEKAKARAKKAVEEMAGELLEIYAARAVAPGHAYSPDDNFYREMEAAFEYEETPDQARAIEEVKSDLETPHPMDRLVCGDVGYGKTEVAVRAAFKAALDGKQAAVMVPTTLLASQHLDTFRARLAAFPVRVEMLSRFTPKSAEKEILAGVRDGSVDIVIGTHRLLSRDVVFGDLGLLVVDEEHRFGVRHKEKLKKMRAQVDVLTMTATPIPRTLNMSLSGIRDLSVIETPPPDRQPIKTVVSRFDKQLIREAILREMERGGRVFFVHNRIDTIFSVGSMLAALVPEARISVAHGRMREDQLERVVSGFVSGSTDVLLSTSIVESGLDIPSANTIIINRADMFGLADLYQLRGRVGRSRVRAYAYLLTPEGDAMTETARKRLTVLSELSGLGAGFRLALHDMEIRGAGNVLGPEQSGQIAAVGFDLYTKLLEEAVMKLKGESVEEEVDPALDLKVSAFIPESYVTDPAHRLGIYKRLSAARSGEELADLADELSDRFGPPPEPALKLIQVMEIKTLARAAKAAAVQLMPAEVKIIFSDKVDISPDRLIAFLGKRRGVARYVPQYTLFIKKPRGGWDALHGVIKNSLKELL